ncbi:hypothetical protein ACNO8S_18675 (plasmid) [Haloarcula sp. KBTZ06]|uniref:hypothetical protein n=1 Tax=unclassified Haloarcula TaxID=2624677 RepID=UPI0005955722|nr:MULTISPECIES: hypothetical protein [unclassified Haloarcula]AJF24469.1 hypothetical protein SG26_01435 [Haloarcula sp. CBA1115]KZX48921.1 hypothetical protein AV929_20000 [Haloarcula sp. K1]
MTLNIVERRWRGINAILLRLSVTNTPLIPLFPYSLVDEWGDTGAISNPEDVITDRALDFLIITNTDWNTRPVVNRVNRNEGHRSLQ